MSQIKNKEIAPDPLHNSIIIAKFVNYLMQKGKKSIAQKIIYNAFEIIQKETKKDPQEIFEKAIQNASPILEVRSKRIGGARYQVPVEVSRERRLALSMRWIIEAARGGKGTMSERLAKELIETAKNEGNAVRKKENVHRMAEANKAFAHFAW
jgi:small subunit ribosomal protein S7